MWFKLYRIQIAISANQFTEACAKVYCENDAYFYTSYSGMKFFRFFTSLKLILVSNFFKFVPNYDVEVIIPHSYGNFATFLKLIHHDKISVCDDGISLLRFASSDLRTHIEIGRWSDAQKIKVRLEKSLDIKKFQGYADCAEMKINNIIVNEDRGKNIVAFPADEPALTYCALGEFKDLKFMADFFSGFMLIERPGVRKISDLDYKKSVSKDWINSYSHEGGTLFQKEFLRSVDYLYFVSLICTLFGIIHYLKMLLSF